MFDNPIHMMSKRKTRTVKTPLCGNVLGDQKDTKLDMFCTIDPLGACILNGSEIFGRLGSI